VAAQDLIIARRGASAPPSYADPEFPGANSAGPDGMALLAAVLRKRYMLLGIILAVSCGLAVLACVQFGKSTAVIKSVLIYQGLPTFTNQNTFDPLGPATGAEMITSGRVLKQLCDKRNLDMSPAKLVDHVKTSIGRSSSLLNVTLLWDDYQDGITVLNDLMSVFIEEMAAQRKTILNDHLKHLELSRMQMNMRVDEARRQLDELRKQQQEQLTKGGLTGDQYRSALTSIANTEAQISEAKTGQAGAKEQIDSVTTSIAAVVTKQEELEKDLRNDYLHQADSLLKSARKDLAPNYPQALQVDQTRARIAEYIKSGADKDDFLRWQKHVTDLLLGDESGLTEADKKKVTDFIDQARKDNETQFRDLATQRHSLEEKREAMQLSLIPIKNQITMLEQRRKDYEKQRDALSEQITGITATQVDEYEHRLEEAEKQHDALTSDRDKLGQLAQSKLREWAVSVPASTETTQLDSNRSKLFVLVFGVCSLLFSAPLFAAEWRTQSGSPQVRFARSLRVPMLADRILSDFSPKQRRANAQARLSAEQTETVRMLTLRIQQSCHNPGSVVLFSSLDPNFSAAPLMATVAECMAEREERVLLIDAVSPDRSLLPVLNLLSSDGGVAANGGRSARSRKKHAPEPDSNLPATNSAHPGLSEYLSEDCEAVVELVRPTGCPGVDLISSGRAGFPREAMAMSCLTELLNTCRKNYTIIMVHGPSADCTADLQMLSARADGVVLVATKAAVSDSRSRACVEDLLELGAPLVGLVA
jgi:Mrp family chromosome partitioning ATPase